MLDVASSPFQLDSISIAFTKIGNMAFKFSIYTYLFWILKARSVNGSPIRPYQ